MLPTANRILNKLKDQRVVRFSVICDPKEMKGLVVFGLLIYLNQEGGGAMVEEQKKNFLIPINQFLKNMALKKKNLVM